MRDGGPENKYIDPASVFLAHSIDSYQTKKTLLEVKLFTAKMNSIINITKMMNTQDLGFRVRFGVGENFVATTSYVVPVLKKTGVLLEFKKIYRLCVNVDYVKLVTLSLWVCPIEKKTLPDEFQSLKTEYCIGNTKIDLTNVREQKKISWAPLNGSIFGTDFSIPSDGAMLAINCRLLKDVPGTFPESPLGGKCYNVGEMVQYVEKKSLTYPSTEAEFGLLQRTDLKYDPARAGHPSSPLRAPFNEQEWAASQLDGRNAHYW